ncbi:hypothetical protein OAN96_00385 [Candidatus Gracilibacteria bacterium]|nr:hypothetical protein [Candidatus Gracilibacteria bacterium]
MKKIFITLFILLGIGLSYLTGYALDPIQVTVSEDVSQLIGGDGCTEIKDKSKGTYYKCPVEQGFGSVQTMIGNFIQYATFLVGLVGVLFIVINGIAYSIGGEDKSGPKDRIMKSVSGLILLLLSGVLLNAIAPWIYTV